MSDPKQIHVCRMPAPNPSHCHTACDCDCHKDSDSPVECVCLCVPDAPPEQRRIPTGDGVPK